MNMKDRPFVLSVTWQARAGAEAQVAAHLRQLVDASVKEQGVIAFHAAADPDQPGRFLLFEIYHDRTDHERHMETDHFQRYVLDGALPLLERRERVPLVLL